MMPKGTLENVTRRQSSVSIKASKSGQSRKETTHVNTLRKAEQDRCRHSKRQASTCKPLIDLSPKTVAKRQKSERITSSPVHTTFQEPANATLNTDSALTSNDNQISEKCDSVDTQQDNQQQKIASNNSTIAQASQESLTVESNIHSLQENDPILPSAKQTGIQKDQLNIRSRGPLFPSRTTTEWVSKRRAGTSKLSQGTLISKFQSTSAKYSARPLIRPPHRAAPTPHLFLKNKSSAVQSSTLRLNALRSNAFTAHPMTSRLCPPMEENVNASRKDMAIIGSAPGVMFPLGEKAVIRPIRFPDDSAILLNWFNSSIDSQAKSHFCVIVDGIDLAYCHAPIVESYMDMYGLIENIVCFPLMHKSLVEFKSAMSAERCLSDWCDRVFYIQDTNPDPDGLVKFNKLNTSSNVKSTEKLSPSSSNKFESFEYKQNKAEILQFKIKNKKLNVKRMVLIKKFTEKLQEALKNLSNDNITDEHKTSLHRLIEDIKSKISILKREVDATKEDFLDTDTKNIKIGPSALTLQAGYKHFSKSNTNPFKIDNRTAFIKIKNLPETIVDQTTFADWVTFHKNTLFADEIEILSLCSDVDGLYGCIKYINRSFAEQVFKNAIEMKLNPSWIFPPPSMSTLMNAACRDASKKISNTSNEVDAVSTSTEANLNEISIMNGLDQDLINDQSIISHDTVDTHHEHEIDYDDDS